MAEEKLLDDRFKSEMMRLMQIVIHKIDGLENRFDGLGNRFDGLENRFDKLDVKVDRVDARLSNVEKDVKILSAQFTDVARVVMEDNKRIGKLESRVEGL